MPVKKPLEKMIPRQNLSSRKRPPPETIPLGNSTTQLKRFRNKYLTTGPGEKIVSSTERRERGDEVVGVHFFTFFSVYLLM